MRYEVLNELRLGDDRHAVGARIDLDPVIAALYVAVGALAPEAIEPDAESAKGKKAKA